MTMPEPLHEGSSKLASWVSHGINEDEGTYMCVTFANFESKGSTVRKSKFSGSTFLQPAFDNIIVRVPKRLRSRSKAYNSSHIRESALDERIGDCSYLAHVAHQSAEMRSFVPRRSSSINNDSSFASRRC